MHFFVVFNNEKWFAFNAPIYIYVQKLSCWLVHAQRVFDKLSERRNEAI